MNPPIAERALSIRSPKWLFVTLFLSSISFTFAQGNSFECAFLLSLLQDQVVHSKVDSHSLIGASYSSSSRENHQSLFMIQLKAALLEVPDFRIKKTLSEAAVKKRFTQKVHEFRAWYKKIRVLFEEELVRQKRSSEEIKVFQKVFDGLQQNTDNFLSPDYLERKGKPRADKYSAEAFSELLQLKHAMGELLYASSKENILCVMCSATEVFAKLLKTSPEDENFKRLMADTSIVPWYVREYIEKTEFDTVSLGPEGALKVFEFKFNAPVTPEHRYRFGYMDDDRASKASHQLFRMATVISVINKSKEKVSRYGFKLDLKVPPELSLSPIVHYQGLPGIDWLIGADAPKGLKYSYSPFVSDAEVEQIFKQLLDLP